MSARQQPDPTREHDVPTALDVTLGSAVNCRDGDAGHLSHVVVEPRSAHVTDLIVDRGPWHHAVVVPIECVVRSEENIVMGVTLNLSLDEVARLPRYTALDYALPDPGWAARHGHAPVPTLIGLRSVTPHGMPTVSSESGMLVQHHEHAGIAAGAVPIGRGTRVTCDGELVGHVDHVLLDSGTEALRAVVVRQGRWHARAMIVPAGWVSALSEDEIALHVDRLLLDQLPAYFPTEPVR